MATDQRAGFLRHLEKSGLLNAAQWQDLQRLAKLPTSDQRTLSAELIRRGWLTAYQINQLARGQGQALRLGPYVLLEPLGEGGMGQVYKARHQVMDRLVALKVIRKEHLGHPDLVKRFHREVRAAAQLTHPNIVMAHDAGQADNTHFFVMEYLEGTDLARLVAENGPLPVPVACNFIGQAATGLHYAHERGMVHRDIKPQNLFLVSQSQTVKILDMGLARLRAAREETRALTHEGAMMGTPDYLAPEQAMDAHQVDIRADIYSLGCSLYHLLTGRPPFAGGTFAQKVIAHQQKEPAPVQSVRPDVPEALTSILRKMMAKQPANRYQTPNEVASALAAFGQPTNIATSSVAPRPGKVDAALAAMPTVVPMLTPPLPSAIPIPVARPYTEQKPGSRPKLFLAVGGLLACVMAALLIYGMWRLLPDRDAPRLTFLTDQVGEIKKYLIIPEGKSNMGTAQAFALSLDGRRALCGVGDVAYVWDLEAGKELVRLTGHDRLIASAAFSPDGKQILTGSWDRTLRLWNATTGKELRRMEGHHEPVNAVVVASGGQKAFTGSDDRTIACWDLVTEQKIAQTEPKIMYRNPGETQYTSLGRVIAIAALASGKQLLTGDDTNPSTLALWQLDKQFKLIGTLTGHSSSVTCLAIAADESRALTGSKDSTVRLWNLQAQKELRRFDGHKGRVSGVALGSDNYRAVSCGDDGTIRVWGLPSAATEKSTDLAIGELHRFEVKDTAIVAVAFFPTGRHIITFSTDNALRIWGLPR